MRDLSCHIDRRVNRVHLVQSLVGLGIAMYSERVLDPDADSYNAAYNRHKRMQHCVCVEGGEGGVRRVTRSQGGVSSHGKEGRGEAATGGLL